jgi:hypothetical protein
LKDRCEARARTGVRSASDGWLGAGKAGRGSCQSVGGPTTKPNGKYVFPQRIEQTPCRAGRRVRRTHAKVKSNRGGDSVTYWAYIAQPDRRSRRDASRRPRQTGTAAVPLNGGWLAPGRIGELKVESAYRVAIPLVTTTMRDLRFRDDRFAKPAGGKDRTWRQTT